MSLRSFLIRKPSAYRFFRNRSAIAGLAIAILMVSAAIAAYICYDFDTDITSVTSEILLSPSLAHPFGTDHLGRDVFKRVLYGSAYSLSIGIASALLGMIIGTALGCVSGYYRKAAGEIVMRINEMFYSIPNVLIATVIVSIAGPSFVNLLFSLSISSAIAFTRTVRSQVIRIMNFQFVESAKAIGQSSFKIIIRHIIPNCASFVIVQLAMSIGTAIISSSSLSFLGIGVPLPIPEWGAMLSDSRGYVRSAFWMPFFPGMAIMLAVLSFNLIGDGLRDAFDVKGR